MERSERNLISAPVLGTGKLPTIKMSRLDSWKLTKPPLGRTEWDALSPPAQQKWLCVKQRPFSTGRTEKALPHGHGWGMYFAGSCVCLSAYARLPL